VCENVFIRADGLRSAARDSGTGTREEIDKVSFRAGKSCAVSTTNFCSGMGAGHLSLESTTPTSEQSRRRRYRRDPRRRIIAHQHLDGTLSLSYGPHSLGRYDADGGSLSRKATALSRGRGTGPHSLHPYPPNLPQRSADGAIVKPDISRATKTGHFNLLRTLQNGLGLGWWRGLGGPECGPPGRRRPG